MIQKSYALLQIMSIGVMDFTPLLCVVGASEGSPFLLISSFRGVDLPIIPSFL
jgi:hypothetical protein